MVFFLVIMYCFNNIDQKSRTNLPESTGPGSISEGSLPDVLQGKSASASASLRQMVPLFVIIQCNWCLESIFCCVQPIHVFQDGTTI